MKKNYLFFDKNLDLKKTAPKEKKVFKEKNNILLANYANIGYYLVTPLVVGVFLGLYLAGSTGEKLWMIAGIVLGSLGTFYNLFKLIKQ